MGLVGRKKKHILENDSRIDNFDNNIVIDKYAENDIYKYINYIDGKTLELDYYSFVKGPAGENTLIDTKDDTQQYVRIKNLQVTAISPITTAAYSDVSFDANIMANLVPAANDIIVLRLIDGRVGMFKVSDITKRTYIAKKNYDFRAVFLYYSDLNKPYFDSLESKVVKNYIYDKSHIATNSAPIILESRYKDRVELNVAFRGLLDSYLSEYVTDKVISYRDKENIVFDTNIQSVVFSVLSDIQYAELKKVESNFDSRSIVTDLLDKSDTVKKFNKKYYSIDKVSYDIALDHTISLLSSRVTHSISTTSVVGPSPYKDLTLPVIKTIPDNYRLSNNNLYLFSSGFYDLDLIGVMNELSLLESLLLMYINNESIDYKELYTLIDDIDNWTSVEVFYYTPFLLLLINYSMLNSYSRI